MCVCMCVCVHKPTPLFEQDATPGHFLGEFNRFEFQVLLLLDWLPYQGLRAQSAILFIHS